MHSGDARQIVTGAVCLPAHLSACTAGRRAPPATHNTAYVVNGPSIVPSNSSLRIRGRASVRRHAVLTMSRSTASGLGWGGGIPAIRGKGWCTLWRGTMAHVRNASEYRKRGGTTCAALQFRAAVHSGACAAVTRRRQAGRPAGPALRRTTSRRTGTRPTAPPYVVTGAR